MRIRPDGGRRLRGRVGSHVARDWDSPDDGTADEAADGCRVVGWTDAQTTTTRTTDPSEWEERQLSEHEPSTASHSTNDPLLSRTIARSDVCPGGQLRQISSMLLFWAQFFMQTQILTGIVEIHDSEYEVAKSCRRKAQVALASVSSLSVRGNVTIIHSHDCDKSLLRVEDMIELVRSVDA